MIVAFDYTLCMRPQSILETILYNDDIKSAVWLYSEVLGFPVVRDMTELGFACRVDESHVLIIFNPNESSKAGRTVPSHGTSGQGHVAFRIEESQYDNWKDRLVSFGIVIEQEIEWTPEGRFSPGRSIYCRDSSGNSVELITADIWLRETPAEA